MEIDVARESKFGTIFKPNHKRLTKSSGRSDTAGKTGGFHSFRDEFLPRFQFIIRYSIIFKLSVRTLLQFSHQQFEPDGEYASQPHEIQESITDSKTDPLSKKSRLN